MSTRKFQLPVSGFTQGLNTEASALTVLPQEFMEGTVNVELLQYGAVRRRRGVDFLGPNSSGNFMHTIRTSPNADEVSAEVPNVVYVRLAAPNGSTVERVVADIDNKWYVYKVDREFLIDFANPDQTVTRTLSTANQKFHEISFAQSGRRVYFAGHHINPGYFQVASDNITLEFVYYDVVIRDPDATQINNRVQRPIGGVARWFDCIESHTSDATNRPGDGTGNWQRYWAEKFSAVPVGTATWATSTSYTTQFQKPYDTNATISSTDTYPITVEFYAGRVWLSGDPKNSNKIYFSQVIDNDAKINRFYQEADPFDSDDPNLVDSDGGVIELQGAGTVWKLIAQSATIFIGTATGIFQITGPDGIFKATNFAQHKVLDDKIGGIGNMTIVDQEIIVFGEASIWLSQIEQSIAVTTTGQASFINLSEPKIATLWRNVPKANKHRGRAIYNSSDRKLYYFYNKDETEFERRHVKSDHPAYFTDCLVLDARFIAELLPFEQREAAQIERKVKGAFYEYTFNDGGHLGQVYIARPFVSLNNPGNLEFVVDQNNQLVTDANDNPVVASGITQDTDSIMLIFMQRTANGNGTTSIKGSFGVLEGSSYQDWGSDSVSAQNYDSKVNFGLMTGGNIRHRKGGVYLYLLFKQVEAHVLNSSGIDIMQGAAKLRTALQWAENTASPYYGTSVDVYFPDRYGLTRNTGADEGHSHVWFKRRIRGVGNTVQFVLENDGNKPFHLVGWNWQFWGKND